MRKTKDGTERKKTSQSTGNSEIIFMVEEALEGGFLARALGVPIFTEAEDEEELHVQVRDAVQCHFEEGMAPKIIRLHFVREEVLKENII